MYLIACRETRQGKNSLDVVIAHSTSSPKTPRTGRRVIVIDSRIEYIGIVARAKLANVLVIARIVDDCDLVKRRGPDAIQVEPA